MPFAKRFTELVVYQRAYRVSLEIHRLTLEFPKIEQFGGVADQMRRASKGVCACIAEGHGKNAFPAEWRRFLMMALGSCQEMLVWVQYAVDLKYLENTSGREMWVEYEEIAKMIQAVIKKSKAGGKR